MADQPVIFEERGAANGKKIGVAQLNAEKALNALSTDMIDVLRPQLAAWAADAQIACVVLCGAGDKAFCAGGDVIRMYHAIRENPGGATPFAESFFETEYRLDYQIHAYAKPILCWGHGIVMGGGLGLMAGASHRVVTERSRIAMPEITIGLYPDVGGTWFLSRMPGRTGLFLGLTGANLNAGDALFTDLADYFVGSAQQDAVLDALTTVDWEDEAPRNHGHLSLLLRSFQDKSLDERPESNVFKHLDFIGHITDHSSVAGILETLRDHANEDDWIAGAAKALQAGSPTSARLIFEQYRRGKHLSLKEAFVRELNMSIQCTRRHDYAEGVRALLVDKDRSPRWQPASIAEVTDEIVDAHFALPAGYEVSPLEDL